MAPTAELPALNRDGWRETLAALHAYARVLGALRAALAPRQKHWWHASLSLQARGVTTTPMPVTGGVAEARIDLLDGHAALLDSAGRAERWYLNGMPAARLAGRLRARLRDWGGEPTLEPGEFGDEALGERAQRDCQDIFRALLWADGLLKAFKARQRRETSPVQLWPHHFDVALLWLSGAQVPGTDPADEEAADQQLNFGFSFGGGEERPYLYVTCYPHAAAFPGLALPDYASWHTGGWEGVRIDYDEVRARAVGDGALLELLELLRGHGEAALAA